jgi:hypothetical protein
MQAADLFKALANGRRCRSTLATGRASAMRLGLKS